MGPLHLAAYNADLEELERLLQSGHDPRARDEQGYTPLLCSCFRGGVGEQLPVVRALLDAGADPNAATEPSDANCLIYAVQSGNADLVSELIDAHVDVNAAADGVTALMQAARDGHDGIVEMLIRSGASPDRRSHGYTAADYARHAGHHDLAARLAITEA
ncbi:ankyrin repeat domain-containing protein [Sphingosinicella sp. BN140058]|uniref:ankyrin repeat domain-containing protein n=1 Tax=Sphingosinicella sp. BN140058 TaxID=1892855 RepID=UPI001013BC84|nr:ankyrin repeat domain-containing protein [Sphingosinicella sp. BN140058]QAY78170.1 hypothetical protein ETR14_17770 [Sphingosinicella sp. BN140058]